MKICFWAATFQADIQAIACHLSNQPDMAVMVALRDPEQNKTQQRMWRNTSKRVDEVTQSEVTQPNDRFRRQDGNPCDRKARFYGQWGK